MKLRLSRIRFTAAKWQSQMLKADFADSKKCAFFTLDYVLPHITTFTRYTNIYRIVNSSVHSTDINSQPAMCLAPEFKTSKKALTFCPSNPDKYFRLSVLKVWCPDPWGF